jgi:hypothetical protein
MANQNHAEKHRYIYASADLFEIVRSFCETQRSYGPDCAPEALYVHDAILAATFGAVCARNCGVWLKDGTDVVCHAVAGPDPLGHWNGVTNDGQVVQWLADEMADWGDNEKW